MVTHVISKNKIARDMQIFAKNKSERKLYEILIKILIKIYLLNEEFLLRL
jgi:hypothetical protein